ncbi:NifB/NifX family molybdenum-iron cluster-binding protein [Candidatus Margulisiibacteriota bacterium]
MKICIPVEINQGIKSKIHDHFGSAPLFLIYDTDTETIEIISNSNKGHVHGTCNPLTVLNKKQFNIVGCKGMGQRAIQKLNEAGIKVYRSNAVLVEQLISEYETGQLEDLTIDKACVDHDCH